MSSLEGNKTIAAVLTAGILAVGAGVVSGIIYAPDVPDEPVYAIELSDGEVQEASAEASQPIGVLLASADVASGEGVAKKCTACHTFNEGGEDKVGPHLWGIVGKKIASSSGFAYSESLAGMDANWDYEALDGFLKDPKGWAPGTKMSFAGISKDSDRADLILYLRSVSPDAPELPPAEATEEAAAPEEAAETEEASDESAEAVDEAETAEAAETEEATEAETEVAAADTTGDEAAASEGEAVAVAAAGDAAAGEKVARKCKACHDFAEGGANKVGPALWGIVGRDIASGDGFSYSDALSGVEGNWDAAALDGYLADPKAWAPGNKMAFAGLKKEEDRADIIAYMTSLQ